VPRLQPVTSLPAYSRPSRVRFAGLRPPLTAGSTPPYQDQLSLGHPDRAYFLTTYLIFWRELRSGVRAWLPASTIRTAQAGPQLTQDQELAPSPRSRSDR